MRVDSSKANTNKLELHPWCSGPVPRAGWVKPVDDQRLSDHVALGALTRTFPPDLVDAVIESTGKAERRNRLLPARLVVYYVLALSLFSQSGYEEVMRSLVEGLAWQEEWQRRWTVPSQPALTQARARLGPEPLAGLFRVACVPLATERSPGAYRFGRRLVSMDGTTLDVPDNEENEEAFGRPGAARGEKAASPRLRLVALAECGTHAMFAAAMGAYSEGENTLASTLAASASPGMLVLADRGFGGSYELFASFAKAGADLCWRVKKNAVLAVHERLSDGSFRSELTTTAQRKAREQGLQVRVVEYAIDDPGRSQCEETTYRLVTTVLDPEEAPAVELAACYAERWDFETALDELKNHQRGPRVVLRSKRPDGVRQEAWGLLCTHYAIRVLMADVGDGNGLDPDRVSFTRVLRAARRSVRAGVATTSVSLTHALGLCRCRDLPVAARAAPSCCRASRQAQDVELRREALHRSGMADPDHAPSRRGPRSRSLTYWYRG